MGQVWPEVLPDGNAILFVIRPENGSAEDGGIAVLSIETGEVRSLIDGGYLPRYAPTGHIVFARTGGLWAIPFDLARLETTGSAVPVVEGVQQDGAQGNAAYAFSNDGLLVYIPGGETGPTRTLVWVDRAGNEEPLPVEPRPYASPQLSSDDQRLAVSILQDGNSDIWVNDLARGTSSRLTRQPGTDLYPIWAPSGRGPG